MDAFNAGQLRQVDAALAVGYLNCLECGRLSVPAAVLAENMDELPPAG